MARAASGHGRTTRSGMDSLGRGNPWPHNSFGHGFPRTRFSIGEACVSLPISHRAWRAGNVPCPHFLRTRFSREACLPTNGDAGRALLAGTGASCRTLQARFPPARLLLPGELTAGEGRPSGGPEPELKYLARYTHRVAMTLEAVEFIRIGGAPRQRL